MGTRRRPRYLTVLYSMSARPVARRRRLLPQHESGDHRPEIPCCGQRFDMTTVEDMQGRVRDEASQDSYIRDRNDRIGIATHDKDRLPNKPQERQAAPPRSRRKLIQVTQARTPDLAVPGTAAEPRHRDCRCPPRTTGPRRGPPPGNATAKESALLSGEFTFLSQHFHQHLRPTRDRRQPGLVQINTNRRHRPG